MGEDSGSIFHLNFTVANKLTQEKGALSFLFLTGILSELLKALLIVCADYFRILRNDFIILKRMAIVNCLNPAFILSNVRKGPNLIPPLGVRYLGLTKNLSFFEIRRKMDII